MVVRAREAASCRFARNTIPGAAFGEVKVACVKSLAKGAKAVSAAAVSW